MYLLLTTFLTNLIAETERVIKLLVTKTQNTFRLLATNKLKQINNSPIQKKPLHKKRKLCVMKKLNQKLATENAIISQGHKGKTIVIINTEEYSPQKVHTFLATKNFNTLTRDLTDKYHKLINHF